MIRVSIAGVTGFTGEELLKILVRHPEVQIKHLISRQAGQKISDTHPSVLFDGETENLSVNIISDTDVVFLCLPHTESASAAYRFYERGKAVIDLSADFRFRNATNYRNVYGVAHPYPRLLSKAVYGLSEFYREKIKGAKLLANPGCYPTASLFAILPALMSGISSENGIVIDAKSGISGAGKKLAEEYLFSSVYGSTRAYSVGCHRHQPEIEQEILLITGKKPTLSFVPHLLPQERGIMATVYMRMKEIIREEAVLTAYRKFYKNERFVKVLPPGSMPATGDVSGTNNVRIGIAVDRRAGTLIVISVIDNLIKGASGQAVQNMNIMFGFEESTALK
ncbi:MAG: N-acetyl-gamma-glutamyl-phosphate reductase [Elusimicrobia bacterium CG08_land_8_20_14_0_20_44_26]|nr:MAG: N-acetyl-gamma-glutamyl-phosphate reductase [Elusimicrobia bacterium CG08_land_8_20_14_0_20_44_26]